MPLQFIFYIPQDFFPTEETYSCLVLDGGMYKNCIENVVIRISVGWKRSSYYKKNVGNHSREMSGVIM